MTIAKEIAPPTKPEELTRLRQQLQHIDTYLFTGAERISGTWLVSDLIDLTIFVEELIAGDHLFASDSIDWVVEELGELEFHALTLGDHRLSLEISRLRELMEPGLAEEPSPLVAVA